MTRQCAWCACYLDSVESETVVTHGICERCAEEIRRSLPVEVTPLLEEVLLATRVSACQSEQRELPVSETEPVLCEFEERAA